VGWSEGRKHHSPLPIMVVRWKEEKYNIHVRRPLLLNSSLPSLLGTSGATFVDQKLTQGDTSPSMALPKPGDRALRQRKWWKRERPLIETRPEWVSSRLMALGAF
jgi:hypothetical protein